MKNLRVDITNYIDTLCGQPISVLVPSECLLLFLLNFKAPLNIVKHQLVEQRNCNFISTSGALNVLLMIFSSYVLEFGNNEVQGIDNGMAVCR